MRKVEHHLLSKLKCPKLFFIKIEKGITSVIQVLNMLNCGLLHPDYADLKKGSLLVKFLNTND